MKTAIRKIDLQLFDGGADEIDYKKVLYEEDGKKLKSDVFKELQPYIDSEKTKHADSLLKKYVPKEEFDKVSSSIETEKMRLTKERMIEREIMKDVNDDVLEDVLKMFDLDKMTIENGKITGLTDHIANLKLKKPSFFKKTEQNKEEGKEEKKGSDGIPKKAKTGSTDELSREELNKLPMKERMEYLRKKEKEKRENKK